MSTNVPQNQDNHEIDLFMIFNKVGNFFQWINAMLFKMIRFFIKNAIILIVLIFLGFGIGLYLDSNFKAYRQQLIVEPKFESTDYLYHKIALLESKISEHDVAFLKGIGIQDVSEIKAITVEPIVDIYKFINSNGQNMELLKLMAQNGDLKTIVEETTTSKNYAYHTISIETKTKVNEASIQPILKYLNTSNYYDAYKKVFRSNLAQKIQVKKEIITQIDGIIAQFTLGDGLNAKGDKLVYNNENLQLNNMVRTKDSLTNMLGYLNIDLLDSNKIINDKSLILNKVKTKALNGKLKLVIPFLFVFLFIFGCLFRSFYKKQAALAQL